MIKTISSTSKYTVVYGASQSQYTYQYSSPNLGVGNVRYNTNTHNIEVSDGQNWIAMPSQHASVGLSPVADDILDWALAKMLEEKQLEEKAKHNKAIADLLEQKKQIEEQLKMVDILTRAG